MIAEEYISIVSVAETGKAYQRTRFWRWLRVVTHCL